MISSIPQFGTLSDFVLIDNGLYMGDFRLVKFGLFLVSDIHFRQATHQLFHLIR